MLNLFSSIPISPLTRSSPNCLIKSEKLIICASVSYILSGFTLKC